MADIRLVKTDSTKEQEGVWVDFAEGIRLKIARAGNVKFAEVLKEFSKPHIKQIRNGSIDDELYSSITKRAKAKTILLDWENIEENGKAVPYSSDKALDYFLDPELADFYNFVTISSQNIDNYRKEIIEEAVKN